MAFLLTNPISKTLLISGGMYLTEKISLYVLKSFKSSRESRRLKSNCEEKCDSGEIGEEVCPVCVKKLEFEDAEPDDIEFGIFIYPKCKHKYHYKCLRKWRLIYKKCAVCNVH